MYPCLKPQIPSLTVIPKTFELIVRLVWVGLVRWDHAVFFEGLKASATPQKG